ncbi:MAG TPA: hypothetical protein VIH57_00165 [Bacteroidales bacterium]
MKIALIELDDSPHDVNFYSQVRFLKSVSNTHVTLICSDALKERLGLYNNLVDNIQFVKKKLGIFDLLRLRKYLVNERFDKVIFNTAHGNQIKILVSMPFPKYMEFIGISHYPDKFKTSNSQKLISRRVKKYFLLNDYLLQDIGSNPGLKISTTYFIFYPELAKIPLGKKNDEIWICIPGVVEFYRRDYESLLKEIERKGLNSKVKFILLGSSKHKNGAGTPLKEIISGLGLDDHFKLWDGFVGLEEFYSYIHESDFIMPLIHPSHESFGVYKNQISGAFNLAFGFKKMLLMEESFRQYDDFKNNSVFYDVENILKTINSLELPDKKNVYKEDKWSFDFQANKYWELINSGAEA